ncbi:MULTISPECIES: hypothetical protein [unclassified Pseudomonas]|uniref:hypothetical protein n=1 Tax=unclassified Pseudomonas TaxID=196821 RepID=UPI0035BEE48A
MKIFVALATPNSFLRAEFLKLRNTISMPGALAEAGATLFLGAPDVAKEATLEAYLHAKSKMHDAILVIGDTRCLDKLIFTETALFIHWMEIEGRVEKPENFLQHHAGDLLAKFSAFSNEARGENYLLTLLPARNFEADEWRGLIRKVFKDTHKNTFLDDAKQLMQTMRRLRKKPRRKCNDGKMYFIDERDKHFIYGKEHHSLPETGHPHTLTCCLNYRFRFGRKVADAQRHFNVNRGPGSNPSVKGVFVDCHHRERNITKTSHLNMFMNDYF